MAESIHEKLKRVRRPRVHITYDVETEGAVVQRELPFVVGVMGDFSGNPTKKLKPLRERSFTQIDRDNFNDVMRRMSPGLKMRVENTLEDDGSEMAVDLKFGSIEDFEPGRIVDQVEPLKKLLDARNRLRDLQSNVDRSEDLEEKIEQILKDNKLTESLAGELGSSKGDDNQDDKKEGDQ